MILMYQKIHVRLELTLGWRITNGRKIYGLQYGDEIEAIMCIAYTIPKSVRGIGYDVRIGFSKRR